MKCSQYRDLMSPYLDGVLSETLRRNLENHLHYCPACREELAALRQTIAVIQNWSEEELDLPAGFVEHLRVRLEQVNRPWYRRLSQSWLPLTAAAAIMLMVAISARADYFSSQTSPNVGAANHPGEQVQKSSTMKEKSPVTPLLALPPAAAVEDRQPAPPVMEKATSIPARAPANLAKKQAVSQTPPDLAKDRMLPAGSGFNLSSRGGIEAALPDQSQPATIPPGTDTKKDTKTDNKGPAPAIGEATGTGTMLPTGDKSGQQGAPPATPPAGGKSEPCYAPYTIAPGATPPAGGECERQPAPGTGNKSGTQGAPLAGVTPGQQATLPAGGGSGQQPASNTSDGSVKGTAGRY